MISLLLTFLILSGCGKGITSSGDLISEHNSIDTISMNALVGKNSMNSRTNNQEQLKAIEKIATISEKSKNTE
jgi:hypothetical protein